jgi:ABC-2 type transport system permease protein
MMAMLRTLLSKDLHRFVRNPVPWLVSLLVPLMITGLLGAIFSPRTGGGGLGTVKVALVDEDDSVISRIIRGMPNQSDPSAGARIEPHLLTRAEAMRRLVEGELAAAVILPKGFTDAYLRGETTIALEIVKNPAQAIHPAVVEEGTRLVVTVLNALRRVLGDELHDWRRIFEGNEGLSTRLLEAAQQLRVAGERLQPVQDYLVPPLVWYDSETREAARTPDGPQWSLFAFLLSGMAAMFLLYLADHAMRDLYREVRFRTLERFKTLHEGLVVFVAGKIVLAVVVVTMGALILFGGGALLFQFSWRQPLIVGGLVLAYAFCAAGLMGLIAAAAGRERRADVLNNIFIMALGFAGGCMFPPDSLPAFLREHVMPLLPTAWFAGAMRALQGGVVSNQWMLALGKLVVLGLVAALAAAALFRRRLEQGVRA